MWAMTEAFVNPELASWHVSAEALLMVLLGGIGALHGPDPRALRLHRPRRGEQLDHGNGRSWWRAGHPRRGAGRCRRSWRDSGLRRRPGGAAAAPSHASRPPVAANRTAAALEAVG
jgi:hypothetical protein